MTDKTQDAFDQLDQEKVKEAAKAEVEKLKEGLVESIVGKKPKYSWEEKGQDKPANYDELYDENDRRYVKKEEVIDQAKEAAREVLKEKEEESLKAEEEKRKATEAELEQKKKDFDRGWYDLVENGKMPKVADEVQERINKNEQLTPDEIMADEGLKARLELAKLARETGKTVKEAFYEDYDQTPAGANAPVIGGKPTAPVSEDSELKYEETAKDRKKFFGF